VRGAEARAAGLAPVQNFQSVTGQGVTGQVDARCLALGNIRLLEGLGIDPGDLPAQAERLRGEGQTVMFLGIDHPRGDP